MNIGGTSFAPVKTTQTTATTEAAQTMKPSLARQVAKEIADAKSSRWLALVESFYGKIAQILQSMLPGDPGVAEFTKKLEESGYDQLIAHLNNAQQYDVKDKTTGQWQRTGLGDLLKAQLGNDFQFKLNRVDDQIRSGLDSLEDIVVDSIFNKFVEDMISQGKVELEEFGLHDIDHLVSMVKLNAEASDPDLPETALKVAVLNIKKARNLMGVAMYGNFHVLHKQEVADWPARCF